MAISKFEPTSISVTYDAYTYTTIDLSGRQLIDIMPELENITPEIEKRTVDNSIGEIEV